MITAFIQFTALKKEDTRIYLHISKSLNEHNKIDDRLNVAMSFFI